MNKRTAKKTKVPPPRKNPAATARKGDDEEAEKNIWLDPDALSVDCDICFMPFEDEVFMCNNGHAACAKCCVRINHKCCCCDQPIGDVRCRTAEKMLAEMNTFCKFRKYGCSETIKYIEKRRHEEACPRAPYGCPIGGCSYLGTQLYRHVLGNHEDDTAAFLAYGLHAPTVTLRKDAPFRLLVNVSMGRVYLLLNGGGVQAGRSLSLVCLGPRPERNDVKINYKMVVRGSEAGVLSLEGTVPCIRMLEGYEAKKFLFVPDADWRPSGNVSVTIHIG